MIKTLKNYDPDKILERMTEVIIEFSKNKKNYDDDDIADMRASLSTGTYIFVETNLAPAHEDPIEATILFEKAEAESYNNAFNELKTEGKSDSLADSMARKLYKMDEKYLEALKNFTTVKNTVYMSDKLLTQANQVLNSMGKRNR